MSRLKSRFGKIGQTCFPKIESVARLHLADFTIDQPTIPESLPEMPAEAREAVEEAALEKIADAGICMALSVSRAEIAKLNSIYAKNKNLICLFIKPKFLIFVISTTDTIKVRII